MVGTSGLGLVPCGPRILGPTSVLELCLDQSVTTTQWGYCYFYYYYYTIVIKNVALQTGLFKKNCVNFSMRLQKRLLLHTAVETGKTDDTFLCAHVRRGNSFCGYSATAWCLLRNMKPVDLWCVIVIRQWLRLESAHERDTCRLLSVWKDS